MRYRNAARTALGVIATVLLVSASIAFLYARSVEGPIDNLGIFTLADLAAALLGAAGGGALLLYLAVRAIAYDGWYRAAHPEAPLRRDAEPIVAERDVSTTNQTD